MNKFLLSSGPRAKTKRDATGTQSRRELFVFSLKLITVTLAQVSFCNVEPTS